jgi:hypothetical protein
MERQLVAVVARHVELRMGSSLWECDVCGASYALQSGMISHLFVEHRVKALAQQGSATLVGDTTHTPKKEDMS